MRILSALLSLFASFGFFQTFFPSDVRDQGRMSCAWCGSERVGKFGGEIAIHFSGLKSLDKPHVYVCAELVVCSDCGRAQFAVPEAELRLLTKRDAAAG